MIAPLSRLDLAPSVNQLLYWVLLAIKFVILTTPFYNYWKVFQEGFASLTFCIYYIIKNFLKQRNAITRKFIDNLNNSSEFCGRHQTLKIHVQEKLHTHNFLRGAGVQESGKPPTAARPPGGGFRDFSILRFHAGFFRGFSRPLINHGERGCSRRKREKSTRKRRRTCKIQ